MSVNLSQRVDSINDRSTSLRFQSPWSIEAEEAKILDDTMKDAKAGYWFLNLQSNALKLSDSFRSRLTSEELNRIDNKGLLSIVHKDDVARIKTKWKEDIPTGRLDLKYRLILEIEGEVWQRSRGRVQYSENGTPQSMFVFMTDATEDVKKEKDLILAEQSSKAKSEFLARMSHEIRTPLNAIIGMADAIKDENLSPDALETVQYIDEAAQGLHQLLTQTLDHAKLISAKAEADWEYIDPKKIVADCMRLWRPQCSKKGLKLNILHSQEIPQLMLMDSFKIGQCLNNLLSNAVKFTQTGAISVILKRTSFKGKDSLIIAVKDTGIGMSAEATSTVFDEFTQADTSIKRVYGGTGLGMNITQRLIQVMEGHVTVSSEKGKGSTFLMVLPIQAAAIDFPIAPEESSATHLTALADQNPAPRNNKPESPLPQSKAKSEYPPFSGLSVLCVEDNPVNQRVIEKLIGKRVDNLYFANNGQEALEKLTSVHVDIVLMDIHMPVMDGIEATLQIRKSNAAWANVIIIALTADPDYQQARICRNLGMNGSIAKPVTRDDIAYAFENATTDIGSKFGQPAFLPVAQSA